MPRQRNRGSQQFGKNENSFRLNSDSFIENKEHFDRGRMDIVEGFTSHIAGGKTDGNFFGDSTGANTFSSTTYETIRSNELDEMKQSDTGHDVLKAPQPTNTPITEGKLTNAVRASAAELVKASTRTTNASENFGSPRGNSKADLPTQEFRGNCDDNIYDSTLGGIGNQRRTLDPIVCKSKNINLITSVDINAKGHTRGEQSQKIACFMKRLCSAKPFINPAPANGDSPNIKDDDDKRSNDINSFDDCENNRSSNEQSTFLINLKSAINAMTAPITDKAKETRSEMTLAPTPKMNTSSIVQNHTHRSKQKMKCTIRQLTTKAAPNANVTSQIKGLTTKPMDKMKCTTRQITKSMETKLNPTGFSQHQIYNKTCAKVTLRNIMKPVATIVNPKGDEGMTERPYDCPAKTLRELSEKNIHHFINLNTIERQAPNNDNIEINTLTKRSCNNTKPFELNGGSQVSSTMFRDSEIKSNRYADILCQLAGFDESRITGEDAKVTSGPEDITLFVNKMTCKSYDDHKTGGSLVPNTSVDFNSAIVKSKTSCTKDISDTFLLIPDEYSDRMGIVDSTKPYKCSN